MSPSVQERRRHSRRWAGVKEGEVGCCDVVVVGEASRFWAGSRAGGGGGGVDISIVFEQQPLLDGWQLVHCLFALAQTQFLLRYSDNKAA